MFRLLFARRADWAAFTVACVLSLTLMSLGRGPQARAVWFVQHTLLAPVNAVVGWLDAGVGVYWENQKLKKRLAQMQMEADAMRAERVENARLRGLLHLSQENPSDLASARVVARSLDRLGGSLTIDKGEKDGILPNRAVLTPDGLVGRVDRSTSHEARVLTLLHRDCSVAVRVGRSRVDGVVQWEFGDRPMLSLLYVSAREDVQAGDDVLTSGLGGIFPEGVRVGSVTKVNVAENGLMKEVQVRPAVNFRSLEDVLIYMPGGAGLGPRMPAVESDVPDSVTQAPVPKPVPKVSAPKTAVPKTSVPTTPVPEAAPSDSVGVE
ncbi:MAG: rod shape-determining protein MreC [Candidatus Eisenbacteria bacterium]|uniref:Cell shape-determining protein MreC n=1 Tax=Eiseniibacteriota bacterium TaxID=2212470 RepID=A0A538T973_UNCEI|nr:MAG: rod shape-determining protein MreC [Candidatus Eisenbacteria bacterium]TMQ60182.1 MAG: rod shape-determining protein MreC [Candidatus Eisenbacteria bacterium]